MEIQGAAAIVFRGSSGLGEDTARRLAVRPEAASAARLERTPSGWRHLSVTGRPGA